MKRFLKVIKNLVFPPRCAGCHTLLSPMQTDDKAVFCPECAKEWSAELCLQCPVCFSLYPECRCQPSSLAKAGSKALLKLAPYGDTPRERVIRNVVLDAKRNPRRRVLALMAHELSVTLSAELDKLGWKREHTVLVHLPRHTRSVRRYGADQSAVLARALAREMGMQHLPLLYRQKRAKPQKSLNAKERAQNLRAVFGARPASQGCHVILVDDVVTTGATLCAATQALRDAGMTEVLCVALAQTAKKH